MVRLEDKGALILTLLVATRFKKVNTLANAGNAIHIQPLLSSFFRIKYISGAKIINATIRNFRIFQLGYFDFAT